MVKPRCVTKTKLLRDKLFFSLSPVKLLSALVLVLFPIVNFFKAVMIRFFIAVRNLTFLDRT